ncbi:UBC-like protein [Neocallimastix lanati (nom. inval.)]|uniref:UBC-like protein n=1 Tax=Neocallimastix californiae TaxID=1754190 RepID=A0A1Y2C085_9FUNG|nr:UBC-like protein [Neocallimastix sp. JGI-2020a]ORY39725.1 UBC-like protein [Neocallimastix californiae]|eukprot:ORY39725.1 UBC-like protein [Neocallimastix californiae]
MAEDNDFINKTFLMNIIKREKPIIEKMPSSFYLKPIVRTNFLGYPRIIEGGFPGKKGTVWEKYNLKVIFFIPRSYPKESPKVIRFIPPIFHPNVSKEGNVYFTPSWYPEYGLTQILMDLQILLAKPCMDYLYNREASELYKNNMEKYNERISISPYQTIIFKHDPTYKKYI